MKIKRIMPFLSLMFVTPIMTACNLDGKYTDVSENHRINYVEIDASSPNSSLYEITIENTGEDYLYCSSKYYGDVTGQILRKSEPFYMATILINPGQKQTFYYETPKDMNLDNEFKYLNIYKIKEENVSIQGQYNVRFDTGYEGFNRVFIDNTLYGLDDDYYYDVFINVIYNGKEFSGKCTNYYWENNLSFDVSKNVNADEITIGGIAVFRSGEQWKFSRIFWKIVGGFFLIVFTPVAIFVAVKIIIVVTAVIAVKVKDKKKVKDNSDNINVS